MCKAMEDMRNETATATKLEDVKNIMETMKLSIELNELRALLLGSDNTKVSE